MFHENETQLEPGDRLLFFTDGILESADSEKVEFGEEQTKSFFIQNKAATLKDTVETLYQTLKDYHGSDIFEDDIAVLGMQL